MQDYWQHERFGVHYCHPTPYGTGWYGLLIQISESEIDILIQRLLQLKDKKDQHFHIFNNSKMGDGGVENIEFETQEGVSDNMTISGFPISPTR